MFPVTDHVVKTPRHTSFYLPAAPRMRRRSSSCTAGRSCRSVGGINCHASPRSGLSRRSRPDMRGYGRSTVHAAARGLRAGTDHRADMIELLDGLGHEKAVWVGHDWGSPVVWGIASHHPGTLPRRRESVRALFPGRLWPAVDCRSDRSLDLSRGRISRRPVGIPAVLSREFRQGPHGVRGERSGDGEGAVSQGRSGRQRQAVADRLRAQGRRLVRRPAGSARPAARHRCADRGGTRHLCCGADPQRILTARIPGT